LVFERKKGMEVKKAIIPVAGLGTRFLPLSKAIPKELFPLGLKPVVEYVVKEAIDSKIEEIIFVLRPEKKVVFDYFTKPIKSKKILLSKYKDQFLDELKSLERMKKMVKFSFVYQKIPRGDGDALLKAKKLIKKEPVAALWADDVIESKKPCLFEMIKIFKTYQKPILAIKRVDKKSIRFYGIVEAKKINKNLFKIERIVEKPEPKEAPSNLAIVGRSIITERVFKYLEKEKGEVILSKVLGKMIEKGEEVLGYEFEGQWLECGNKFAYLKSNLYLTLKDKKFKKELKKFLKEKNLL
jgi:UTP--glucose-1-phosphate uridylyltransferase